MIIRSIYRRIRTNLKREYFKNILGNIPKNMLDAIEYFMRINQGASREFPLISY